MNDDLVDYRWDDYRVATVVGGGFGVVVAGGGGDVDVGWSDERDPAVVADIDDHALPEIEIFGSLSLVAELSADLLQHFRQRSRFHFRPPIRASSEWFRNCQASNRSNRTNLADIVAAAATAGADAGERCYEDAAIIVVAVDDDATNAVDNRRLLLKMNSRNLELQTCAKMLNLFRPSSRLVQPPPPPQPSTKLPELAPTANSDRRPIQRFRLLSTLLTLIVRLILTWNYHIRYPKISSLLLNSMMIVLVFYR